MVFVSGGPDSYCYEPIFSIWLLRAKTDSMCTPHIAVLPQENMVI